ncbi:MAG: hypothetical protein B6245_07985 [Desulfobacteraceae bacterium 4572_88]|nr:MAG: hypothetical protein B6245_07985 [Desulfobacteraceae bacterium 4572_88]
MKKRLSPAPCVSLAILIFRTLHVFTWLKFSFSLISDEIEHVETASESKRVIGIRRACQQIKSTFSRTHDPPSHLRPAGLLSSLLLQDSSRVPDSLPQVIPAA